MNWDLTSYFPSFDSSERDAFERALADELQALLQRAAELPTLDAGNAGDWEQVLLDVEDLSRRLSHLGSYLGCLTAGDAADESYKKAEAAFARTAAEAEKLEVELQRGLKQASAAAVDSLARRPAFDGCVYHLRRLREEARRTMSPAEERLSADLGVDGIHAWGRLYDTLSGKLEFDMPWPDGRRQRLPMAQRRSLMSHPDRAVRRAAFEGGNAAWEAVQDVAAAAINAISGTRLTLNRHRGVDHFPRHRPLPGAHHPALPRRPLRGDLRPRRAGAPRLPLQGRGHGGSRRRLVRPGGAAARRRRGEGPLLGGGALVGWRRPSPPPTPPSASSRRR